MMTPSPWRLDGHRALILGGSRGIGRACADELLRLGARVGIVSRTPADAAWRGGIPAADAPIEIIADVSSADGRQAVLDGLPTEWNALDALVNCVGTNIRRRVAEYDATEYEHLVSTNMTSVFELTRRLHPRLAFSGRASVVLVGSVAAQVSVGSGAIYAMTKAGVAQLTRMLAVEWGREAIRVNLVARGTHAPTWCSPCCRTNGPTRASWIARRSAGSRSPRRLRASSRSCACPPPRT